MDLDRLLNSVGKQIFVKYYYFFKDQERYANSDFLKIITENFTDKSKFSRTSHARTIFNNNLHKEALKIITTAKVPSEVRSLAWKLLSKEIDG